MLKTSLRNGGARVRNCQEQRHFRQPLLPYMQYHCYSFNPPAQTSRNKTQRKNGKPLHPKKNQDPHPHSLSNEYLFRFWNITVPFLLPFQQRWRVAWQIPSPIGPLGLSLWFARPWSFARVYCCTDILIRSKRFAMSTIFCNASPLVREERASELGA